WQRVIVAEINRDPRDERDPKEQIDVCPKNDRIDPGHEVNEMMMVDPVDSDDDEAQDIGKKGRPHLRQGSWGRIVRGLQLQNHDGNENSDNAIAERFDPVGFHAWECNTGASRSIQTATERCREATIRKSSREIRLDKLWTRVMKRGESLVSRHGRFVRRRTSDEMKRSVIFAPSTARSRSPAARKIGAPRCHC